LAKPEQIDALVARMAHSQAQFVQRQQSVPEITYPDLPVAEKQADIKAALSEHQVVIVAGETGSGKTTQLPKICLELGRGVAGTIAHTQPRRLAARSVADRIAQECGVAVGATVGCKIRFNDRSSDNTLVKLMTDGILLAEIQHDRYLSQYDTIIIDEAHERSLNIDFLLGYLRQLLPKRPDLKVIITSATIDPERFAEHFAGAPIISVSGRTYPVEVRYQPLIDEHSDGDGDLATGIIEAVNHLRREPMGDILVFLSGEREIREIETLLNKQRWASTEVVPLYARLAAAEQNKIFSPHAGRRIILATNVAETSLTVPGIRYVIDPGYARISRYSYRTKVQRLPIEAISQASAKQRAGRCGRVADGICIRLYSEDDFVQRPEFTDPEILRTNLASVILQMLGLGLGDIHSFPFVQPPDQRFINDGIRLLEELQAITRNRQQLRLTPLGRQLARLPIDPRYARMVLAAVDTSALMEVSIIVAGLSIQDPRERPLDKQQAADEQHQQFVDNDSDFITLYNIYQAFLDAKAQLSQSQLRKWCKQHFLHYLRMREWQDIVAQLAQSCREMKLSGTDQETDYQTIHCALATGLLSHAAMFDKDREYLGARNMRVVIFPGSPLAKKRPKWLIAAELVETSRLFARYVARIDAHWLEPLAKHLTQSSLSEPYWSAKQGAALATEKVSLFGLPIIPARKVNIAKREPVVARELFIREGLVNGFTRLNYAFLATNQAHVDDVVDTEQKTRRRDLLVSEDVLVDFYAQRIPEQVVSEASFRKWYKGITDPEFLTFDPEMLWHNVLPEQAVQRFPNSWQQHALTLPLSYVFSPNSDDDGVTVHIPLGLLNQVEAVGFEWLVPGMRQELLVALIKALPKRLRRNFVPAPQYADACLGALDTHDEHGRWQPLLPALAAKLARMSGVEIDAQAWDDVALPTHLRMRFAVVDDEGKALGVGRDLLVLKQQLQSQVQASLENVATPELEQSGVTDWSFDELPDTFTHRTAGFSIHGFPALVSEGNSVAIKIFDQAQQAQASHTDGLYTLIKLQIPSPIKYLHDKLPNKAKLGLYYNPFGQVKALIDDCIIAGIAKCVEDFCAQHDITKACDIRDEATFRQVCEYTRAQINDTVLEIAAQVEQGLTCANTIKKSVKGNIPLNMLEAVGHIKSHLEQLVYPHFVSDIGAARLKDWQRYLNALAKRVEKLKIDPTKDRQHQIQIDKISQHYANICKKVQIQHALPDTLLEVRWMIEELRVSFFAQQLGTQYPISVKRIEHVLAEYGQ
jgi:ATP-dependent helicase HrpA